MTEPQAKNGERSCRRKIWRNRKRLEDILTQESRKNPWFHCRRPKRWKHKGKEFSCPSRNAAGFSSIRNCCPSCNAHRIRWYPSRHPDEKSLSVPAVMGAFPVEVLYRGNRNNAID